jgi:hypothetical protein
MTADVQVFVNYVLTKLARYVPKLVVSLVKTATY